MGNLANKSINEIGQHILLYGPPKSGKTLLAGMVAKAFRTFWFDLEHGFVTLKQLPMEVQQNITLISIPDTRQNHLGIETMLYVVAGKPVTICDFHGEVVSGSFCAKCKIAASKDSSFVPGVLEKIDIESSGPNDLYVLDSGSQLSNSALSQAVGTDLLTTQIEFKHYMKQGLLLDRVLNAIQISKANWVYITHEESIVQEDNSEKIIPMSGTRNFSRNTAKYFDHVVYCSIKNRKYDQNSNGLRDAKILTGSRTNINLETGVTDGLITLLRSVKGSETEKKALSSLKEVGVIREEEAPKPKVVSAATQAVLDRIAASKAKAVPLQYFKEYIKVLEESKATGESMVK
jgi:hypothetical protein